MIAHRKNILISPHNCHIFTSPPSKISFFCPPITPRIISEQQRVLLEEYELIPFFDAKQLMYYKHRAQLNKVGTPKIVLFTNVPGKIKVYVQKSSMLLFQVIKKFDRKGRILKLLETFKVFSDLARDHGFFYVDKEMMRVNKKGEPLNWFNHNFSANHRQFAIKHSDVAEVIFIKKLKITFS